MSATASSAPSRLLPRALVVLLGMAALVVTIAGLRAFSDLLSTIVLALVLSIAAAPMQSWFARRMPRWVASTVTLVIVYAIMLALVLFIVVSLAKLADLLPSYSDNVSDIQDSISSQLQSWGVSGEQASGVASNLDIGRVLDLIVNLLEGLLGVVGSLFFLVTLLFFVVVDAAGMPARAAAAARLRPDVVNGLVDFVEGTQRYLIVTTIFGLIVAVLDTVALLWIGVPLALLWGLLSFITNYIPNIGFVIGVIPPALLALLDGGWREMLAVIAVYCVLNVVIQTIIQPKFVGESAGIATSLTFVAMIFWTWVLGPIGALLAIPMTLLSKALLVDIDPDARWVLPLIQSGTPAMEPEAPEQPEASAEEPPGPDAEHALVPEGEPPG